MEWFDEAVNFLGWFGFMLASGGIGLVAIIFLDKVVLTVKEKVYEG